MSSSSSYKSAFSGNGARQFSVSGATVSEAPTSPRTRLSNYALFLRPLSAQLIRATEATRASDIQLTRHEAARAYYRLGELVENSEPFVSSLELEQLHRLLDLLFHETIAPHSLKQTRIIFKTFLFRIESKQPSSLTLAEMRTLVIAGPSASYLEELGIVRVAHCLNQGCLALLAAQTELAFAYFDFIGGDISSLATTQPNIVDSHIFAAFLRVRSKLKNRKITSSNARAKGAAFRQIVRPVLEESERILAHRAREYMLLDTGTKRSSEQ